VNSITDPTLGSLSPHVPSHSGTFLRLRLMGPMAAWDGQGRSVLPRGRKARAILALLALVAPMSVPRRQITSLLWSTRMPAQARGSLRQSIHELQDMLAAIGGPLLRTNRDQVAIDRDGLWVDVYDQDGPFPPGAHFLTDLSGLDPAFDKWLAEERARRAAGIVLPHRSTPPARALRLGILPPTAHGTDALDPISFGLAEEITSALSGFRWIDCVGPASLVQPSASPPLAEPPQDRPPPDGWAEATDGEPPISAHANAELWEELALDFLLDGSVQHLGSETTPRLRVSIRLRDLRNAGALVWSRRFERSGRNLIELQDDIAANIAAQLDPELMMREGARIAARPPVDPTAYELVLRAIPAIYRLDAATYRDAGNLLERAVQAAPDYAAAHAWYAYWHLFLLGQGWERDRAGLSQRAEDLAERAVMLDPADARALAIAGHIRAFLHNRIEEALPLHERALELNPNLPLALVFSGLALAYMGEHETAIARISRYRELSPLDPHAFLFDMALMVPHLLRGDFEEAVEIGRRSLLLNPGFSSTYKVLISALGHLGRAGEASAPLRRLLAIEPDFSIRTAVARTPLRMADDLARYAGGLRMAGVPE